MNKLDDIKNINNDIQLAEFLGVDKDILDLLINNKLECRDISFKHSEGSEKIGYFYFTINKKNGGQRIIYEANHLGVRNSLKKIRNFLNAKYIPLECVHGFIKGKGIKSNAKNHLEKRVVINIDIVDFFGSIKIKQIQDVFKNLGANEDISLKLAKITTRNGYLPQGFCTSPVLSNLVMEEIDNEIMKDSKLFNYTYTRYGDDMTFSSMDKKINLRVILEIIKRKGFFINYKKFKAMYKGSSQIVTGLSVSDNAPRIPRKIKKLLRFHFYYLKKFGALDYSSRFKKFNGADTSFYWIEGWNNYLNAIEPELSEKYCGIISEEKLKLDYQISLIVNEMENPSN